MKHILQHLSTGATELIDVPCPRAGAGELLIRTHRTLVSAGTERMLVEFGKANLLEKARQQPDKVRMVLEKVKTDGLLPTIQAVKSKLDQPLPMGYCNAGTVLEVGRGVSGWTAGDRVASNGKHAEMVVVPVNLCAKVPAGVSDDDAAFTVLASIGLQGIRLAQPTLGEAFVVTGLGLIGLITVQLLRAQGCRVLGIDFDSAKIAIAKEFGAEVVDLSRGEDPLSAALVFSRGRGVDGVLVTASTQSSEPIHQAAQMCRKRGRIVLVGVTGLDLSRADFYEKELTFQVSCSYGPGRYDQQYEQRGHDYPIGFVRWTEQRNFEAVLDMLASGSLNVRRLVTHRFPLERAAEAYELVTGSASSLGILLEYDNSEPAARPSTIYLEQRPVESRRGGVVGVVGAGNYATQVLIPALARTPAVLKTIATSGGVSGTYVGRKFGFRESTTDPETVFNDPSIDAVIVMTRHNTHTRYVCRAIESGKSVFVEKPLALTFEEIDQITNAYGVAERSGRRPMLMVGFNRRFAPQVQKMKALLGTMNEPKAIVATVNAGAIPADHWTQDPEVGGGRIVGEACHFIDLLRFLVGRPIKEVRKATMGVSLGTAATDDKAALTLTFEDGSLGTVHYYANGHKSFPKERIEVFCGGRILQLDNFRQLRGYGWPGFGRATLWKQDKGQKACIAAFIQALTEGGQAPIPFDEIIEVSRASIEAAESR